MLCDGNHGAAGNVPGNYGEFCCGYEPGNAVCMGVIRGVV